jgi:tetratricopeptide (TPR) repeat protein
MINELQIPCVLNIAACLKEKGQLEKALLVCEKAIILNAKHYKPFLKKGNLLYETKNYEEAKY